MLNVRVAGEGPAVVWLHGYTMDSTTWAELWSLLPGFRHVGIDLPGHGRSDPLAEDATLPAVAAEVADIVRSHSATRLVALSFGTMIALQVVIDNPDLITQLVLAAPALAGGDTEPGADVRYREIMRLYMTRAPAAELVDAWMTSPPDIFRGTETRPMLRFRLRSVILRHRWTELRSPVMGTVTGHPQTDTDLAALRPQIAVLLGDQDMPVTTAVAHRIAATAPSAKLHVLANTGHLCLLEDPAASAGILAAHLT